MRFLKSLGNFLVVCTILLFLGLGIVTIGLQFPSVQTWAVRLATESISQKLGYPVSIGRVNIKWFDVVSLEQVSVRDTDNGRMIDVGRIDVNLQLKKLLNKRASEIRLDDVTLFHPDVKLVKRKNGDLNIDGFIARITELTSSGDTTVHDQNTPFYITNATIADGIFTLTDPFSSRMRGSKEFDYNNFTLRDIEGKLSEFLVLGDTIAFDGQKIKAVDIQTGLAINRLDTRFLYCNTKLELDRLDATINQSHIRDYISLNYLKPSDLGRQFNEKVTIRANFNNSRVHSEDLGLFAPYLLTLNEEWRLTGRFDGEVNDFRLSNTNLGFGNRSQLIGDFGFKGLPEFGKTLMDFRFNKSKIYTLDLVQYYPESEIHKTLQKLGEVALDGTFKGDIRSFAVKADFGTEVGDVQTDLAFTIKSTEDSRYKGRIAAKSLDLGRLFEAGEYVQKLDFNGSIQGMGFSLESIAAHLDAHIPRVGLKGYEYRNITFKGDIQKSYFDGELISKDTNFVANLEGQVDLSGERNAIDLRGVIERANLKSLGFITQNVQLHTGLDIRITGNDVDDVTGKARFINTYLHQQGLERNLVMDSLIVSSEIGDEYRQISVNSEFVQLKISGDFVPSLAYDDLSVLLKEYKLYFKDDAVTRKDYYFRKKYPNQIKRYSIDYQAKTKNFTRVLDFFYPDLYLSKGAEIEGNFRMGNTAFLTLTAKSDTVRYQKNEFYEVSADVTTSKFSNSQEVLASASIISRKQQINSFAATEYLELDAGWDEDHIDFSGDLRQQKSTNRGHLDGEIRFTNSGLNIGLKPSTKLNLLDGVWQIADNNQTTFEGRTGITFRNLSLQSGRQRLSVNGNMGSDSLQNILVEARYFNLSTLNPLFNTKLGGILDGKVRLKDLSLAEEMSGNFDVEALSYDNFEFGNFIGSAEWDHSMQQLLIDSYVEKNASRVMNITGSYFPMRKDNSLNVRAVFTNAELKAVEPFSKGLISDLNGKINGSVQVRGSLDKPIMGGELQISEGKARFDYLQAMFTFNDKVYITENEIMVRKMKLTDPDGNIAMLSGGVYHDAFKYFTLGFEADLHGFRILNTTEVDNELFYGTAYVTGKAAVYGLVDNLNIDATVTSNKGTKMYIPMDNATEVSTQDYIRFVSQLEKERVDSLSNSTERRRSSVDVSGIKMNFNFNITPDAYCEILMDRQAGDQIRAYGKGLISMKIDTKGEFVMVGGYEIEKGDFTYTFQNALNKKFNLKPGSRISWTGSPYDAVIDVKAGYQANVSLLSVLRVNAQTVTNNPNLSRRYPVEINLTLTDRLTSPKIGYSLKILEFPPGEFAAVTAFENRLKNDEQELSRQVSSFLVFNQLLSVDDQFFASSGAGISNSVSELISNQISKWASTLDENLEIGVSGLFLDQSTLNNIQLRFSYRFLNDRFRITRDGRFTYGQNQYDAASLLGDWTLEYWWTRSGSVRVKAFNRNIQSIQTTGLLANTQTTGGVSLSFNRNFNRILPWPKRTTPLGPVEMPALDTLLPDTSKRTGVTPAVSVIKASGGK